jgi:cytochrome c553
MKTHLLLWSAVLLLAACGREEHREAAAPAASAASAPTAQASAPAGPIIAPAPAAAPVTQAQLDAGTQLASQGGQGVPACNTCHGAQGEGNPGAGSPRIAGQSRLYLAHELEAYANGSRKHPVMQPIASALNADQRVAVAAHFAALAPSGAASGAVAAASAASAPGAVAAAGGRGSQLASVGDNALGVQGCANCHGPGGVGAGEVYPYLAGQHASYLTPTLGAWRDGSRNDDPTGQMPQIAKALSDQDVKALAAYYAAQPPRDTAVGAERMAPPVAAASAPAVVSGPQTASAATMGSGGTGQGTEQGSPLTGAQGQGGGGTGTQSNGQPNAAASSPR